MFVDISILDDILFVSSVYWQISNLDFSREVFHTVSDLLYLN